MASMVPVVVFPLLIVVRLFGTVNVVKLAVLANAPFSILVKAVFDKSRVVMPEFKKARCWICVIAFGKVTVFKLVVFWKVPGLISATLVALKSIVVKPELANAEPPSVVNPAGRFTLVKLVVPWKALSPIIVTLLGISIAVKLVVPWKALCPICVNPLGSLTLLKLVHPWNRLVGKLVTWVADKSMVVREVQSLKIEVVGFSTVVVPKLVKLFGTFTSVKLEQPWKALLPIVNNFVA